jgi:hypothetical protein
MMKKTMLGKWFLAVLLLVSIAGIAQAETQLKQLGVNPFYGPEIKSNDDFRRMVKETRVELKKGFDQAGASDLFDDFVAQVGQPDIREIDVNPGERLQWMIFRKGKTVKVVKDVVWAGKEPFAAFLVNVDKAGVRYTFVVPAKCGNVSLALTQPLPVAKVVDNNPPFCQVAISPLNLAPGKDVTIDASQSGDTDGSIAAVFIQVEDANSKVIAKNKLDKQPFIHQLTMNQTGDYTIRVSVFDDKGKESFSPGCVATMVTVAAAQETVVKSGPGHFVADAAIMHQPDPATYLLFRIGYDYRFNDSFSVLGMVGVAPVVDGKDDDDSIMADITGIYHYQRMYVGAGVGAWHSSMDDRVDFIVNAGYRVYGEADKFNIALFVEGRAAFDQFDELNDYGRLGAGLRFQF